MQDDYRTAPLEPRERALCDFAAKSTARPAEIGEGDIVALRTAGLDDGAILEALLVIGHFNYINRVMQATGVESEPDWPDDE